MLDPASRIDRHLRNGVLVDTNLLLVYLVGYYDYATGYQTVNRSRYTKGTYDPGDFDILNAMLERFRKRITTPHILAEVSNLVNQLPTGADTFCIELLKNIIPALQERTIPAEELAKENAFVAFGVADTSIIKAAQDPCLVLTDDFKLSGYMASNGMDVLNFHEIKYAT